MKSVYQNGQVYTYEEIKNGKFLPGQALTFCSEWLNKKQVFSIGTSGSTGVPKVIEIKREHMIRSAGMTMEALGLQSNYKSLVCLNTEFIGGKMMLVRSLEAEMEITIIPPSSNPLKEFSNDIKFDFVAFVPFQLETVLKESPEKTDILHSMKAIIVGGAAINALLEEKIQYIKAPVYHTYGMTETISHIALRRINGNERSEYFTILKDITISLDKRGCLVITSPFSDQPIVTNDIIEIIDNRHFKWLGRIDNVINSGGLKIHPEEIELKIGRVFNNLNLANRFYITGTPHAELGEAVSLVIEDESWEEMRLENVKKELIKNLSRFEIPKFFHFKNKFLETPSGKIDRVKMRLSFKI